MISSAICDKTAQVNFSKTNQIARALTATAIWFVQFTGGDLPQIARKKIMWLLVNNIHKFWLASLLLRVIAPCYHLQMTTSTKIGLNFDRWILMHKNAEARSLFTEKWSLLSFYIFNFSCFSTAAKERTTSYCDQDSLVVFCLFGFWLKQASQQGFHRWLVL